MLCRICIVQIQPRQYVLDDADYTAPTGNMGEIIQVRNLSALKDLDEQVGIDDLGHDLSDV